MMLGGLPMMLGGLPMMLGGLPVMLGGLPMKKSRPPMKKSRPPMWRRSHQVQEVQVKIVITPKNTPRINEKLHNVLATLVSSL